MSNIDTQINDVLGRIGTKREELQRAEASWDDWKAGKLRLELGALQQRYTDLRGAKARSVSVDSSSRNGGSVFFGSNF